MRTPAEVARENPKSKALAIWAKCWDCEGAGADPGWQRRVHSCVVTACPLWPVRPYQREDRRGHLHPPSIHTAAGPS